MWFFQVEWRYITLLGITIECVDNLPDDCDRIINDLLIQYPVKPAQSVITSWLQSSRVLQRWFRRGPSAPKIIRFNLESPTFAGSADSKQPAIDTLGDLADWLEITQPQLDWFTNTWRHSQLTPQSLEHYRYQLLAKRDGRIRLIEKPKPMLKRLQRKIYDEILGTLDTHPAVHGFCKNRGCLSHASVHSGKTYLCLFDIADCFQSIEWKMVKAVFNRMGYPQSVCVALTSLCTHSVRLEPAQLRLFNTSQRERLRQRHLPQGAPVSPALANAAMHRLDQRLTGLAHRFELDYSRYADDIAMSGNTHRDWRFLEPLIGKICMEEGLSLNYKKTRIKKPHQKQRVTGIVVNSKTNVDRKYFDTLKAILTNCKRYGLSSQNRQGHPNFRAHLVGRIQYVKSLNEQKGLKLEQIYQQISR